MDFGHNLIHQSESRSSGRYPESKSGIPNYDGRPRVRQISKTTVLRRIFEAVRALPGIRSCKSFDCFHDDAGI